MSGVRIRVSADSTRARADLSRLERSITSIDNTTQKVTRGFRNLALGITAAVTGSALTKGIANASDSLINLENKLALVVGRGDELGGTLKQLYGIAAGARLPIASAAETFNRFGLALSDSGRSTAELLLATEAVLKSATLSGATAESANAAIIQLGQGLASGQLRGEELNSVLEQMPRLARAIADGMGIPFGKLRELAKDGKLEAETVFDAIISQYGTLEEEFQTLEETVGGLTTILKDEFTRAVANLDKEFGFSKRLIEGIKLATEGLRFFADNIGYWAQRYRIELAFITNDFYNFKNTILRLFRENFDIDITSVTEPLGRLKTTLTDFFSEGYESISLKVEALNLEDFIPSLDAVVSGVKAFVHKIKDWFYWLYMEITGNSLWWDIFSERVRGIAGPMFTDALALVVTKLTTWGTTIVGFFEGLYEDVSTKWNQLSTLLTNTTFETPSGTVTQRNTLGQGIDYAINRTKVLRERLGQVLALNETVINPRTLALETQRSPIGKLLDMLGNGVANITVSLSQGFADAIDSLYSFWVAGGSIAGSALTRGAAGAAFVVATVADAASHGRLIAQGFIDRVLTDAEFAGGAVATAFIAKLATGLSFKTLAVAGIGLVFSSDILNSPVTQKSLESLGRGIGTFLGSFFRSEEGSREIASGFIDGLKASLQALGGGLLDGLFGEEKKQSEQAERVAGTIGALIVGFLVSGKVRKLFIGGGKILFSSLFNKETAGALSGNFTKALRAFKWLTIATTVAAIVGPALEDGFRKLFDSNNPLVNGLIDTIDEGVMGAAIGGVLGGMFGPFGVIGGAIIGGLAGSFIAAMAQGGNSAIFDFGVRLTSTLKDIFQQVADWLVGPIVDAFAGLWDSIGAGMPNWARKFFGIDPIDLDVNVRFSGEELANPQGVQGLDPNVVSPFATGGYVSGEGGPTDDKIPAMLSNGEYVLKASAVSKFGTGTLDMLNRGMVPKFATGGQVGNPQIGQLESDLRRLRGELIAAEQNRDPGQISNLRRIISSTEVKLAELRANDAEVSLEGGATSITEGGSSTSGGNGPREAPEQTEAEKVAEGYADNFQNAFSGALFDILTGEASSETFLALAQTWAYDVLDTFSKSFTEALFEGLGLDTFLEDSFEGIADWAKGLGGKTSETISENLGDEGAFSGVFSGLGDFFKGISSTLGDLMSSVMEGFGGGGGIGGAITAGLGFLGFSEGGLVPSMGTSRTDIDSVPAMLTPGELVVPADKVKGFLSGNGGGSTQTFQINVTGDISRQTKQEIMSMIPQIAGGVNRQNKENNFRR